MQSDDSDTPKSPMDLKFMDNPVLYIREKVDLFWAIAKNNPVEAIKFVPEVAGGLGLLAVTFIAIIVATLGMSGTTAPPQVKKAAADAKQTVLDAKDKVVDAATTGAEKVQAEANKRTTRSSGPSE